MEQYTIRQIADKLNISRQYVYSLIKSVPELEGYKSINDKGVTVLSEGAIPVILDSLSEDYREKEQRKDTDNISNELIKAYQKQIEMLTKENERKQGVIDNLLERQREQNILMQNTQRMLSEGEWGTPQGQQDVNHTSDNSTEDDDVESEQDSTHDTSFFSRLFKARR